MSLSGRVPPLSEVQREKKKIKARGRDRPRSRSIRRLKERKKADNPNEGLDEDRVPTCTSRILDSAASLP